MIMVDLFHKLKNEKCGYVKFLINKKFILFFYTSIYNFLKMNFSKNVFQKCP